MVRPPRSALRSASAPAVQSRRGSRGCSPGLSAALGQPAPGGIISSLRFGAIAPTAGSGSIGFSPGSTAVASAAAFTRPGRPPLPGASHSAITGGGKWLRRKRSRQGIRPVTPFAHALPFLCVVSCFSLAASSGFFALATRLKFRFAPSSYFRRSDSPNEPIMHIMQSFAGVEHSAGCSSSRPPLHVYSLGVTPAKRYIIYGHYRSFGLPSLRRIAGGIRWPWSWGWEACSIFSCRITSLSFRRVKFRSVGLVCDPTEQALSH